MENWKKEGLKRVKYTLISVSILCITFIIGYFLGSRKANSSRPVEEIVKADSLIKVNDSIKIKVEQLDSIKNAKIIEVQTLDNDSTIKLFYELISK